MILADENLPESMVQALANAGFSVVRVSDVHPGADDATVLQYAFGHGLIVVTQDTDFGELVYREGRPHHGVVLVRLRGLSFVEKARRVVELFQDEGHDLRLRFTVISNAGVRLRD